MKTRENIEILRYYGNGNEHILQYDSSFPDSDKQLRINDR